MPYRYVRQVKKAVHPSPLQVGIELEREVIRLSFRGTIPEAKTGCSNRLSGKAAAEEQAAGVPSGVR